MNGNHTDFWIAMLPLLSKEEASRLYYELQLSRNIAGGLSEDLVSALARREHHLQQSLGNVSYGQVDFEIAKIHGYANAGVAQVFGGIEIAGGASHITSGTLAALHPELRLIYTVGGSTDNFVKLMVAAHEKNTDEVIINSAELMEHVPKVGEIAGWYGSLFSLGRAIEANDADKVAQASMGLMKAMTEGEQAKLWGFGKDMYGGVIDMKKGFRHISEAEDQKNEVLSLGQEGIVNMGPEISDNIYLKYNESAAINDIVRRGLSPRTTELINALEKSNPGLANGLPADKLADAIHAGVDKVVAQFHGVDNPEIQNSLKKYWEGSRTIAEKELRDYYNHNQSGSLAQDLLNKMPDGQNASTAGNANTRQKNTQQKQGKNNGYGSNTGKGDSDLFHFAHTLTSIEEGIRQLNKNIGKS